MKTAEEWVDIETGSIFFHAIEDSISDEEWVELIKQIQLDAWKQGMSDAEQIVKSGDSITIDEHCEAILTSRDNTTLI